MLCVNGEPRGGVCVRDWQVLWVFAVSHAAVHESYEEHNELNGSGGVASCGFET